MDIKKLYGFKGIEPPTIVSSFALTFYENGQITNHPTINAQIRGNLEFDLNEVVRRAMIDEDYYDIQLPAELTIPSKQVYDLTGDNKTVYGQAILEGNKIHLVFNDKISELSNVTGEVHFLMGFDKTVVNTGGNHEITIPGEPTIDPIDVNVKSLANNAIDKRGMFNKEYNPTAITWQVDFNKANDVMTNAAIEDILPSGTALTAIKVYKLTIDSDTGEVAGNDEITTGFSISGTDVTFTGTTSSAFRIEYYSDITNPDAYFDKGTQNFLNTATWSAIDMKPLAASASLTANYGKMISKTGTYDPSKQSIKWTIKYNYSGAKIPSSSAIINDIFKTDGLTLIPDSFDINKVELNDSGAEIGYDPVDETEYSVTPTNSAAYGGFDLKFDFDVDTPIKIVYETSVAGIVEESKGYGNEVDTEYNDKGYTSVTTGTAYQQNVIKRVVKGDEGERVINWQIRVNANHYELHDWKLTDILGDNQELLINYPGNQQYGGVKITDLDESGYNLVWKPDNINSDYKITTTGEGFEIEFLNGTSKEYTNGTNHEFLLEFATNYNKDFTSEYVPNTAEVEWKDPIGGSHESSSTDKYYRTALDLGNGAKYGEYNAKTKRITWRILVNNSGTSLSNASLVDVIQGNQVYIKDSLHIYEYEINSNNEPVTIAGIGSLPIVVGDPDEVNSPPALTISFPSGFTERYWVEFQTSLEGQYIHEASTYDNQAVFEANYTNGGEVTNVLDAKVSVQNGDKLALKKGTQNPDGSIHWEVTVNPSQSTLTDAVVTDIPSDNQKIKMDSIKIYKMTVEENGDLTKTNELVTEGSFYTTDYSLNETTGKMELKIKFLETIVEPYFLEYDAYVFMTDNEELVSNKVVVSGTNKDTYTDDDDKEFWASYINGGGSIRGDRGAVTLKKVDLGGQFSRGSLI